MVLAHVTVRQDIIAELLRRSQARTMPEHEPGVRAQHGDMVGDGAGIRWAGADVDHGDALKAGLYEMESRHLRHALDGGARRSSAQARIARDHIAGLDKRIIAGLARGHALAAQLGESIDIKLVVRENHEV